VIRETKSDEARVALTPSGVRALVQRGHRVLVERGCGLGSGLPDEAYASEGAELVAAAPEVIARSRLVLKVKEPTLEEAAAFGPDHIVFAYLHLAAVPELAAALQRSGATCVAYETVTDASGRLPLLIPMSEIAGRIAAQAMAWSLQAPHGGLGVLVGGAPGVAPARVLVLGGGAVGVNAASVAAGMGADVVVFEASPERLREVDRQFSGTAVRTRAADALELERELGRADAVIGAVLLAGARAPKLIGRAQLGLLRPGSVLVDVSIDQGGCFETSRPTTHSAPVFDVGGIVHYCVANMPGAVPRTATHALCNSTLPYVCRLADEGEAALERDPRLGDGLNVRDGELVHPAVARALAAPAFAA
jgi:alanine dehydrogenase